MKLVLMHYEVVFYCRTSLFVYGLTRVALSVAVSCDALGCFVAVLNRAARSLSNASVFAFAFADGGGLCCFFLYIFAFSCF